MAETKPNRGISLNELFLVMFIGLKISGAIDWSWWLVLIPVYVWVFSVAVSAAATTAAKATKK